MGRGPAETEPSRGGEELRGVASFGGQITSMSTLSPQTPLATFEGGMKGLFFCFFCTSLLTCYN